MSNRDHSISNMDEATFLDYCTGHIQLGIGRSPMRLLICDIIFWTKERHFRRIMKDLKDPKNHKYLNLKRITKDFKKRKRNGKSARSKSK